MIYRWYGFPVGFQVISSLKIRCASEINHWVVTLGTSLISANFTTTWNDTCVRSGCMFFIVFLHVMKDSQYVMNEQLYTLHPSNLSIECNTFCKSSCKHVLVLVLPTDPRILSHNYPKGPRKNNRRIIINRRPRSSWGHDGHRCVQLMFGGPKWNSRWFWWLTRTLPSITTRVICRLGITFGDGWKQVDGGERCSNLPSRVKNRCICTLAKWYKTYWGKLQLEMMRYLLNVSWRGNPNP